MTTPTAILPQTIDDILAAGGSVVADAEGLMPQTLVLLAGTAKAGGGHLTLKRARSLIAMKGLMVEVARAAPGQITFDVTE